MEACREVLDTDGSRVTWIERGERYPADSPVVRRHHLLFTPVDDESEMLHDFSCREAEEAARHIDGAAIGNSLAAKGAG